LAVALEGFFGSGYGAVGVFCTAHENLAYDRLIARADDGVNGVCA
jgi:hypothetical protein